MKISNLVGFIVLLLVSFGCDRFPIRAVNINDIQSNPTKYETKEIIICGKVTNVVKIPFVGIRMYMVNDGSGELPVIAGATLPGLNENVTVTGIVDSTMIIGDQTIGLKLREIKRF